MSNVAESDNYTLAYHKSHVAYAQQMGVKIESDRNIKNLSDIVAASVLYGAKVLDVATGGGRRGVRLEETP